MYFFQFFCQDGALVAQVDIILQMEKILLGYAEVTAQPERSVSGYAAAALQDLLHAGNGYIDFLSFSYVLIGTL